MAPNSEIRDMSHGYVKTVVANIQLLLIKQTLYGLRCFLFKKQEYSTSILHSLHVHYKCIKLIRHAQIRNYIAEKVNTSSHLR